MAKVAFSKLDLKKNQNTTILHYNEEDIEVKEYVSINDKLEIVSNIINLSLDDKGIINYGKINVYTVINILKYYTNISFTEKQLEDPVKLYDLFIGSGLYRTIVALIPRTELDFISDLTRLTAEGISSYRNSAVGVLETISQDYSNLNFDATELQKKIGDPENLAFLKEVLTKLG